MRLCTESRIPTVLGKPKKKKKQAKCLLTPSSSELFSNKNSFVQIFAWDVRIMCLLRSVTICGLSALLKL